MVRMGITEGHMDDVPKFADSEHVPCPVSCVMGMGSGWAGQDLLEEAAVHTGVLPSLRHWGSEMGPGGGAIRGGAIPGAGP